MSQYNSPSTRRLLALLALSALGISGCTHVAGMVEWSGTKTPVPDAQFSVGPPESQLSGDRFTGHPDGTFSFYLNPLDTDDLWVWSGQGHASLGAMHLSPREVNDHMVIELPQNR